MYTFLFRYDFTLTDDEQANLYSLELCCPRFLDTSLIDADVQPHYVRVLVKGKVYNTYLGHGYWRDYIICC